MFRLLLIATLIFPLVGLFLIEDGEMGGYHNNSVYPYFAYLLIFWTTYLITSRKKKILKHEQDIPVEFDIHRSLLIRKRITYTLGILVFISMVPFKGYQVLTGQIEKGDFRTQMGYFGFVMAILTKYLVPSLFARICLEYYNIRKFSRKLMIDRYFLSSSIFCIAIGLSFGSKATGILILTCGVIPLLWKQRTAITAIALLIPGLTLIFVSSYLFDSFIADRSFWGILDYVLRRAFVLTAEAPWKAWDLYRAGPVDFNYPLTLAQFLGSGLIFLFFGVAKYSDTAYKYEFTTGVTALFYPTLVDEVNSGRWNITCTSYVEGLLAMGLVGIPVFAVLGGYIMGRMENAITKSMINNKLSKGSVLIVYYVFAFFSWVNSGGIVTLFHPITIVGILFSYYFLRLIDRLKPIRFL